MSCPNKTVFTITHCSHDTFHASLWWDMHAMWFIATFVYPDVIPSFVFTYYLYYLHGIF